MKKQINPFENLKIVVFHNILENKRRTFISFIEYLSRNYDIIEPQLLNDVYSLLSIRRPLLITFDDGFYSNYLIAHDYLKLKNIKSVFFVSAGLIDLDKSAQEQFLKENLNYTAYENNIQILMNWKQICELKNMGHTIGSHTIWHKNLNLITDAIEIENEINKSGDIIEDRIESEINHFAIPFGKRKDFNNAIVDKITAKYKFCFTTLINDDHEKRNDSFLLNRKPISLERNLLFNALLTRGWLNWKYRKL